MTFWLLVAVAILVLAIFVVLKKTKSNEISDGFSFEQREFLFTPAEWSFFGVLDQVLDKRYRVFGKVRFDSIKNGLTTS